MVDGKVYFDFYIGKFRFLLKKNYKYRDKETGKIHYNYLFNVSSLSYGYDIINWISLYSGWNHPCFVYSTCSYEDSRHNLHVSLGYGNLFWSFPWKNKNVNWEDVNHPQPKYGFYLYGNNGFFDSFCYYVNKDGESECRSIYMPWSYDIYRCSWLKDDGEWHDVLESDVKKVKELKEKWEFPYYIPDDSSLLMRMKFPFKYVTKNGMVQETIATVTMEEREWRPKWFKWTKLFNDVYTSLNINFDDEMGNLRGSWKGGVLGCGCEVTEEEKKNMDFETPLRRYEEKVNRLHDFCK